MPFSMQQYSFFCQDHIMKQFKPRPNEGLGPNGHDTTGCKKNCSHSWVFSTTLVCFHHIEITKAAHIDKYQMKWNRMYQDLKDKAKRLHVQNFTMLWSPCASKQMHFELALEPVYCKLKRVWILDIIKFKIMWPPAHMPLPVKGCPAQSNGTATLIGRH